MLQRKIFTYSLLLIFSLVLAACTSAQNASEPANGKLKVVATTTLVGDVVRNISGERVDLSVLLPVDTDPHNFEPSPKDVALVSEADIVFTNGAGLEAFMTRLLENAGGKAVIIPVSEGLSLIEATAEVGHTEEVHPEDQGADPHVWMDPNNVMHWADRIEQTLSEKDPANAATYQANAQAYRQSLKELDGWIQQQVAQVPQKDRKIVSDHLVFGYFAKQYGFEQVGTVIPSTSTLAQPSAQELAALEDTIRKLGVKAIFVESTVNPALSQRIADDTQTKLVSINSETLSDPQGPAATYLDFMRTNVSTIVQALK